MSSPSDLRPDAALSAALSWACSRRALGVRGGSGSGRTRRKARGAARQLRLGRLLLGGRGLDVARQCLQLRLARRLHRLLVGRVDL